MSEGQRLFVKVTRESLPQVKDKYPFLYLERGRLEIDDSSIKWIDASNNVVEGDGKLLVIGNQIDPNTGSFQLKAEFPNANNQLFPGQYANTRLQVSVDAQLRRLGRCTHRPLLQRPDREQVLQQMATLEGTGTVELDALVDDRLRDFGGEKLRHGCGAGDLATGRARIVGPRSRIHE